MIGAADHLVPFIAELGPIDAMGGHDKTKATIIGCRRRVHREIEVTRLRTD